jgi:hypothetical protein
MGYLPRANVEGIEAIINTMLVVQGRGWRRTADLTRKPAGRRKVVENGFTRGEGFLVQRYLLQSDTVRQRWGHYASQVVVFRPQSHTRQAF